MTEDEARALALTDVPRGTAERLDIYVACLREAAAEQNLVAKSTLASVWERHILDSAQLVPLAPSAGLWLDIGSGAGLPGLVIAARRDRQIVLIEPRAKRVAFLRETAERMGVADQVTIIASRAETAAAVSASVISARAVAPLADLFAVAQRFAAPDTIWLLPKGRTAADEVAAVEPSWHARIELVPSVTDSEAAIVVATEVRPKKGKRR